MIMIEAFLFIAVLALIVWFAKRRSKDYRWISAAEWLQGMRDNGWNLNSQKFPPLPERHAKVVDE